MRSQGKRIGGEDENSLCYEILSIGTNVIQLNITQHDWCTQRFIDQFMSLQRQKMYAEWGESLLWSCQSIIATKKTKISSFDFQKKKKIKEIHGIHSPVYKFNMMLSIWKENCRNVATSFFGDNVDFLPSNVWTSTSTDLSFDDLLTVADDRDLVSYVWKM